MFEFKITPEHGDSFEVTATSRDVLVWEKTTKGRTMKSLRDDLAINDLYKIAHLASKRQQLFTGTLQEFEETCDLDFEEEEEPDPTQSGASTEA